MRRLGGTVPVLAALHAALVGWAAWYLVEAGWSAAPLSASPTPLHGLTFLGSWLAGTILLLLLGPPVGWAAVSGGWMGLDPTRVLPLGLATRAAWAWASAFAALAVVGLAPLPIYLALYELGAFAPAEILWPVLVQVGCAASAPLPGIMIGLRGERRGAP